MSSDVLSMGHGTPAHTLPEWDAPGGRLSGVGLAAYPAPVDRAGIAGLPIGATGEALGPRAGYRSLSDQEASQDC